MTAITKPLLAEAVESWKDIRFPVMSSPKFDGIRCLKVNGKAMTRNFKPIPNEFIRKWLEANAPDGFDGELMVKSTNDLNKLGLPKNALDFCDVTSGIMRGSGEPDFYYAVFDYVTDDINEPYEDRYDNLVAKYNSLSKEQKARIKLVEHILIKDEKELAGYETICLKERYEGVMIRSPDGPYKLGRSHVGDGILLKIKRFKDAEAEIIDLMPMMHNDNVAEDDAFGHTKRSSCKDGMVEMDTLGKFVVQDKKNFPGVTFEVGTGKGLTQELRKTIWDDRSKMKGRLIKYKYQDCGTKDLPRFPVWLGFRDKRDV